MSSRCYRNRRIGELLKELHLTGGRNTGFHKIIRALKANSSPMPIFETDDEWTYSLTTFQIYSEFTDTDDGKNGAHEEFDLRVGIFYALLGFTRTIVGHITKPVKEYQKTEAADQISL